MNVMDEMLAAAVAAAEAIAGIYAGEIEAARKPDNSPVTLADTRAEAIILERLASLDLPVLAEESVAAGHIPELGEEFFVVDPLDGTREFLKRNGEFTVNIALCRRGHPRLGVVLAPATGMAYWGGPEGAFSGRLEHGTIHHRQGIRASADGPLRIVASRSHGHPAIEALCRRLGIVDDVSVGSSLKFGLLASGAAELYPRFGPTSEWDTAAGQAVLEAAGGVVLGLDGKPLSCGHRNQQFLNGPFVAAATRELADRTLMHLRDLNAA